MLAILNSLITYRPTVPSHFCAVPTFPHTCVCDDESQWSTTEWLVPEVTDAELRVVVGLSTRLHLSVAVHPNTSADTLRYLLSVSKSVEAALIAAVRLKDRASRALLHRVDVFTILSWLFFNDLVSRELFAVLLLNLPLKTRADPSLLEVVVDMEGLEEARAFVADIHSRAVSKLSYRRACALAARRNSPLSVARSFVY